ncbi:hypothetical protein [Corynebacterium efficiens YS-314]|uniref:Uncharacterized protein n=1 Tax=Corynebacterium efficiens (strain DSM 44549 / YS-314 / AJ 12310 / JCM 11189 / NBRC 100395) TaxID=196164 RepID=Q8FTH2_COREF|nr:hypothetical protein [Corynebacterium efficiens YS-314]
MARVWKSTHTDMFGHLNFFVLSAGHGGGTWWRLHGGSSISVPDPARSRRVILRLAAAVDRLKHHDTGT